MSFDPQVNTILQYATNFFSSAYPVAAIVIGTAVGGIVLGTLIGLVVRRRNG